jgi:hypothetical protein
MKMRPKSNSPIKFFLISYELTVKGMPTYDITLFGEGHEGL